MNTKKQPPADGCSLDDKAKALALEGVGVSVALPMNIEDVTASFVMTKLSEVTIFFRLLQKANIMTNVLTREVSKPFRSSSVRF